MKSSIFRTCEDAFGDVGTSHGEHGNVHAGTWERAKNIWKGVNLLIHGYENLKLVVTLHNIISFHIFSHHFLDFYLHQVLDSRSTIHTTSCGCTFIKTPCLE